MDLFSVYKIYNNNNKPLTYIRYFRDTKSGKDLENLKLDFDTFFHYICLKYNNYMFSTDAIKISLDMITDYHIKWIIETGTFPSDLEEDFSDHFENNWYMRLSLEPFRNLIGKTYFSKYAEVLRKEQREFNIGFEYNPDSDMDNEIGTIVHDTVIKTLLCSRIYYGSKMNNTVANAIRQRYPHLMQHVYEQVFNKYRFIYDNRQRLGLYVTLKKLYLDFTVSAITIQRIWRKYRLKHRAYFLNIKIANNKINNKRKRGIIEDDRCSSNKEHIRNSFTFNDEIVISKPTF
jgi:hypothetical protein